MSWISRLKKGACALRGGPFEDGPLERAVRGGGRADRVVVDAALELAQLGARAGVKEVDEQACLLAGVARLAAAVREHILLVRAEVHEPHLRSAHMQVGSDATSEPARPIRGCHRFHTDWSWKTIPRASHALCRPVCALLQQRCLLVFFNLLVLLAYM